LVIAEDLAKEQKSISVAEFFEKNKHLLGFDSPTRGVITTVKEAVDNALDACEEAGVLPDIFVGVERKEGGIFRITVEDNGPGIVPEQVPYIFGKLLYGSRFHQIRQSRGQQGIGISAAVLYAQLTTGRPTTVISRTGAGTPAHRFHLMIDTATNEPQVLLHRETEWDRLHGTRVEIEFSSTLAAKKRLMDYLRYTSVVNPHTRIMTEIDGETHVFDRVSDEVVPCPKPVDPHPHGIEIGTLKRMTAGDDVPLSTFLTGRFSRVGDKTATEILKRAGLDGKMKTGRLGADALKRLLGAMQETKVPPPSSSVCLSPIGEDLIRQGLDREFRPDFVRARTRPAHVFAGHSFIVEAAIAYGGRLESEGQAYLLRFANRVPLLYQQGACAITGCATGVNWKAYGLTQQGLPMGPLLLLVHVASTNVPFTSESKDAIAAIPEIEREIVLALQDLGRDLKTYLSRRDRKKLQDDRARAVCSIIPEISEKVAEIVDLPVPDTTPIEAKIMRKLVAKKRSDDGRVYIGVSNYTEKAAEITVCNISGDRAEDASQAPDFVEECGGEFSKIWKCRIEPGATWEVSYTGGGGGTMDVRGVDDAAKAVIDLDHQ